MSRDYSGDEGQEFPGEWALYRANTARILTGKSGRALLLELRAYLEAMPSRRLIEHNLARNGEVCTVGALVAGRRASDGTPFDVVAKALSEQTRQQEACLDCDDPRSAHDLPSGACRPCDQSAQETIADWDARGTPADRRWRTGCAAFAERDTDWEEDESGAIITVDTAADAGVPRRLAWRLMDLNDQELAGLTPEARWRKVVAWIDETLSLPIAKVIAREVEDVVGIES